MAVIVGVDPGTAHTGFGVVSAGPRGLRALDGGVIATDASEPIESRLCRIHTEIAQLLDCHRAAAMAVEDVFFGQNARTAFAVGQARGAAMCAAGLRGVRCYSYTPQAVKSSVCGSGRASKEQVQRMVQALLSLSQSPRSHHAADALAVAVCHANGQSLREAIA